MAHLTYEECIKIQVFLEEGFSHRLIARKLGRSNSSISDEIRKYSIQGVYVAKLAWITRKTKRKILNTLRSKIPPGSDTEKVVMEKIALYWSPEQIAGRLKIVNKDTIYKWIKQSPSLVKKYCRRRGKPYKYGTITASYIYNRVSIHERPKEIENYERLGDWEGDTVGNGCVTYIDRKSKYLLAGLTNNKKSSSITSKTVELFNGVSKDKKKSITLDNGREFVEHYMRKGMCGVESIYFADPGQPGQRGLNENTNGLLRQFFDKKTDFKEVTEEEFVKAVELINNRPRKSLNYKTPTEVFFNCADLT